MAADIAGGMEIASAPESAGATLLIRRPSASVAARANEAIVLLPSFARLAAARTRPQLRRATRK